MRRNIILKKQVKWLNKKQEICETEKGRCWMNDGHNKAKYKHGSFSYVLS